MSTEREETDDEDEPLLAERLPEAQGIDEFLAVPILLLVFLGAFAYILYVEGVLDPAHAKLASPLPIVIVCIVVIVVFIFALLYRIADGNLEDLEELQAAKKQ